jgi:hypothetical protein
MANDELSDLKGGVIVGPESEEEFITLLADGTAKAGWAVGNNAGAVAGTDTDAVDTFVGFLVERYDTDLNTAPTATVPVRVVKPKSGHKYRVKLTDLNASGPGIPLQFGSTAGALSVVAAVESAKVAYTWKYTDGDTFGVIVWA